MKNINAILAFIVSTNVATAGVLEDVLADMQLNEAPLLNAPVGPGWAKGATIEMGGAPRGDATPYWWNPTNTSYKSSTPWTTIAPWFVIYPGTSNAATNTRVKVYGLSLYVWNKTTHQWIKIDTGTGKPLWAGNYGFNLATYVSNAAARIEPDGELSYKLDASSHPVHGGLPKIDLTKFIANPLDIGTVIVYIKSQLILDNASGIDDRASAQLLFNVGADYYPTMASKMTDFTPMTYVPSVGSSRFGVVKITPRTHYMATIDPPGTLSNISNYTINGNKVAMPQAEFEANPPPFIPDTTAPSTPSSLVMTQNITSPSVTVNISWGESNDNVGVAGYKIYRNGVQINTTTNKNYIDTIIGNPKNAIYSYTIKAYDAAGNISNASQNLNVTY